MVVIYFDGIFCIRNFKNKRTGICQASCVWRTVLKLIFIFYKFYNQWDSKSKVRNIFALTFKLCTRLLQDEGKPRNQRRRRNRNLRKRHPKDCEKGEQEKGEEVAAQEHVNGEIEAGAN